ncbi:MAG: hypothetical protein H0U62_08365 [Actinobacteria bacterium]|jgi:hypothetical protein|nr:hypothetical protein [Actinomycetota bacterium]
MDDYQIPTTDGRYLTLRFDEETWQTVIRFPHAENSDDEMTTFEFTLEDAEHFVDALDAIRARATGGAAG